ncbi:DUF4181 domain-containing protein [Metabacillus endolithicus]|uniref:DUF4181 domain-containing protein n=1 Tax=Metabacillus endolithicus TaxID=1535204 RepID=A0ABW5BSR2_9BACI|nr:DUF4181 domain-containing protein [Metabacillus endolithicus]UPG63497.1 DUF4181 domain-containing protein [Metabacillus endolithicus]
MIVVAIFISWFILDLLLRYILGIKLKKAFKKFEHHDLIFKNIDRWLFIAFLLFLLVNIFLSFMDMIVVVFIYLAITSFLHGMQEWKFDKENREYIFTWLGTGACILLGVLYTLGITAV